MANSRKYIPVDEIFSVCDEHLTGDESMSVSKVKTQIQNFEQKAKLNFNKSYHAPPPPGTQMFLPKIGNYKPKILLSQTSKEEDTNKPTDKFVRESDVKIQSYDRPLQEIQIEDKSGRIYESNVKTGEKKGYMLIGDENPPIFVPQDSVNQNSVTDDETHRFNTNPLFDAENSDGDHIQRQDVVVNYGETVKNPLFDEEYQTIEEATSPHSTVSPRSPDGMDQSFEYPPKSPDHPMTSSHSPRSPSSPNGMNQSFEYPPKSSDHPVAPPRYKKKSKPQKRHAPPPPPVIAEVNIVDKADDSEYPYIPPPDYEEDELTMDFNDDVDKSEYGAKIFKEYEGDDFAKYLSDDEDYEFDSFTWRKNIKYKKKRAPKGPAPPRPKSEISLFQNKKPKSGALKPIGKPKHETQIQSVSRSTIREFSFADSKLSGNRTTRSTSALGRYAKRGKERPRIEEAGGSYEEFLRMKQSENGSNSSADSGQFSGDENQTYLRSQPKEMRGKYRDDKPHSVWQKLTWKFRHHVGGYEMR